MSDDLRQHLARILRKHPDATPPELAALLMPVVDAWTRAYAVKQMRDLALEMSWPDPRGMWRASDIVRARADSLAVDFGGVA